MRTLLRISAFLLAGLLTAQAPQPPAAQNRIPKLPPELAAQVARDEKAIDDHFATDLADPSWLASARKDAQHAADLRSQYQGDDWWQTREATWRLWKIKTIMALTPAGKTILKRYSDLGDQSLKLMKDRKYRQALQPLIEELSLARQLFGFDSPEEVDNLQNLAAAYLLLGRLPESEQLILQACDIAPRKSSQRYFKESLAALGNLYAAQHHYSAASTLFGMVRNLDWYLYEDDSNEFALDLMYLASSEAHVDPGTAERYLSDAVKILERLPEPNRLVWAYGLRQLGEFQFRRGNNRESQKSLREAQRELQTVSNTATNPGEQFLAQLAMPGVAADLAIAEAFLGNTAEAAPQLVAEARLQWEEFQLNFPSLSSEEKRQFLDFRGAARLTDVLLSLAVENKLPDARAALDAVLLTKSLQYEAEREESAAFLASVKNMTPPVKADWEQLRKLKSDYSRAAAQTMLPSMLASPRLLRYNTKVDLRSLRGQIADFDQKLREESNGYAASSHLNPVSSEDVLRSLRAGEALVEYVHYETLYSGEEPAYEESAPSNYAAIVAIGGSNQVVVVKAGEWMRIAQARQKLQQTAKAFARQVNDWAATATNPEAGRYREAEIEFDGILYDLRQQIWNPVERYLDGVKRVYVAPDEDLALIPFEALATPVKGGWRYLAEDKTIGYVNTGRDLFRLASQPVPERRGPRTAVFAGDPAFDATPTQLARLMATGIQQPLPNPPSADIITEGGTAGAANGKNPQALAIPRNWRRKSEFADLLANAKAALNRPDWKVVSLSGADANVESLLRLKAPPALLLFATHGFFLPEASCGFQAVSLNLEPSAALPACEGGWENPLNRSVLALAGSNRWRPDNSQFYWDGKKLISLSEARDLNVDPKALEAHTLIVPDGILTAYQVTGLNLFGTELVSLTACETGTGEVTRDGVAGLREAIFLAGARSVVMSLWEIPVTEARDQMTAFYSNWQSGQASSADRRLEAFHKAQVAELNRQRTQRGAAVPFYWAASIYAGDPGDLPRVSAPAQK